MILCPSPISFSSDSVITKTSLFTEHICYLHRHHKRVQCSQEKEDPRDLCGRSQYNPVWGREANYLIPRPLVPRGTFVRQLCVDAVGRTQNDQGSREAEQPIVALINPLENRNQISVLHVTHLQSTPLKAVRNAWCSMKWDQLISLLFWKLHVISLMGITLTPEHNWLRI